MDEASREDRMTTGQRRCAGGRLVLLALLAALLAAFPAGCGRQPGIYHTVHQGETLYGIGRTYGVGHKKIMAANDLRGSSIKPGQRLYIPGARRGKLVPKEKGGAVATKRRPGKKRRTGYKKGLSRKKARQVRNQPGELPGIRLIWPIKGGSRNISSSYGKRGARFHDGVDIRAKKGTSILAAEDGKVIYSNDSIAGYGNMIIIKHIGKVSSVYSHNDVNLVRRGQIVEKGQIIGKVGRTGRATGDHLHFEVRNGKTPVNPVKYLP